jgi:peptidyl-prolyl cis-trans isomerase C
MYKKVYGFILLAGLLLGLGACAEKKQTPESSEEVVAQVGEAVLTDQDLELDVPEAQRSLATLEQKKDYVRRWIENEILYQEAKNKKVDQDENLKWEIYRTVRGRIIEAFLEKELGARVTVSEEEAKEYYQKYKDAFKREADEVRLSHILVRSVGEAALVAVRVQQGESFAMVAGQMSLDEGTKKMGGDMGYVVLSDLPPPYYEQATRLGVKEISGPIATDYGFDIIMVTDRKKKGSLRRYELVEGQIVNSLTVTKRKKELANLFQELKKEAKVQTFGWASGVFPQEEP